MCYSAHHALGLCDVYKGSLMPELMSQRQQKILEFLQEHLETYSYPPTVREIGAIQRAISAAYPSVSGVTVTVSPNLVFSYDMGHNANDLGQFANYLQRLTAGLLNATYPGVIVVFQNGGIVVTDYTQPLPAVQINFEDLVGQPTWIETNKIQIRTVLRSDIIVGSYITLPKGDASLPGFVQTTYAAMPSSIKYQTTFAGQFIVQEVRQIGHYRMPDGNAWISVFNAVPAQN